MSVQKPVLLNETGEKMLETFREMTAKSEREFNEEIVSGLDGTFPTYKKQMRKWFYTNGAQDYVDAEDYDGLTALVDKWYELTRERWCGWTEFYQPDVSAVTYGTKGGDNADLTCTPSTDTVENQDDYAGLPLFACVDCNWVIDETTLRPVITAIDGITSNFKRKDTSIYVGVLQMSAYVFTKEDSDTYTIGYSATRDIPYANVEPLSEAVNPDDNTVRSWMIHAKYYNGNPTSSAMTCCAGVIPRANVSHNTLHTGSANNGTGYSATCMCDISFVQLMMMIKYGSLTLDGILQGCCNNYYQHDVQITEEGVKRVIIATGHKLEVGMSVLIGNYSTSLDRAQLYGITGIGGAIITKIETITVDDAEYSAVYVDTDDTFDTAANGSTTEGTTYISTFHWPTGSTDGVLGNDGSPTSCTSGKYPAKIQGIEYMNGGYEVGADAIMNLYKDDDGTYWYELYLVRLREKQSTAITEDYEATGLACEQPSTAGWNYIKKLGRALGVFFPTETGGSSSTYTRDGFYQAAATYGATREVLAFGYLSFGVTAAGASCLHGDGALSGALWACVGRLSPNGNRGEWAA